MKNRLVRNNSGLIGRVKSSVYDGYVMVHWFGGAEGTLFAKKWKENKGHVSVWNSLSEIKVLSLFDTLKLRAHQFLYSAYYNLWLLKIEARKSREKELNWLSKQ